MVAAWRGHAHALALLAWFGADLHRASFEGSTPVEAALARGNADVLLVLRGYGIIVPAPRDSLPRRISKNTSIMTLLDRGDAEGLDARGGFCVDGAFGEAFLGRLEVLWRSLPVSAEEQTGGRPGRLKGGGGRGYAQTCAKRSLFCDVAGVVGPVLGRAVTAALGEEAGAEAGGNGVHVFSRMRFLHYPDAGGSMQPHVDLSKKDVGPKGKGLRPALTSTHTFILHLFDCKEGGETVFLRGPALPSCVHVG